MKEYKAGIYLRLSKEDTNTNNSIEAQRDITLNYAKKHNISVINEYVDNGDLEYFDVEISEVLFSKSGTYMVIYGDETLGVASWKWKDMDDKTLYYSWDGEWYDDCTVQISFEGSSLVFYEETDDFGEFEEFDKIEMYTYLKEK